MKLCTLTGVMLTAAAAALLASHGAPAAAAESPLRYAPLTPMSQCLDPDRIRTWHFLDSDEVLVDAGRKHFLLQLSTSCPELTHSWQLGFRAGNSVGRICGNLGDSIVGVGRSLLHLPCRIASVKPLDEEQFARELELGRVGKRGVVSVRDEAGATPEGERQK
jgi:hypothetical protein